MPANYTWNAVNDAAPPTIQSASSVDAFTVRVIFSEDVLAEEALDASNYTFTGGLTAVSVSQESPAVYLVVTSAQTPAMSYTVTATNIHDLAGNLI